MSCPRWGPIWGTPDMEEALDEIRDLGATWISVHPYARISSDGSLRIHPTSEADFLDRAVAFASARNLRVFWKPHLAYWGTFSWRGAITFDNEEGWQRFFVDYRRFVLDQAVFAERHRIPLFAVGTELDLTASHELEWRNLIQEVRMVYSGKLTYAANWDAVDTIPFWDALDYIGVQAYYPLAEQGELVTAQSLSHAWDRRLDALRKTSESHGDRRVLFTEIGYSRSRDNAQRPWLPAVDRASETVERRTLLLDTALRKVRADPLIVGMFWWKWMPGTSFGHDADFSMKDSEAREALRRAWRPAPHRPAPQEASKSATPPGR